jgi:hypothetical protein
MRMHTLRLLDKRLAAARLRAREERFLAGVCVRRRAVSWTHVRPQPGSTQLCMLCRRLRRPITPPTLHHVAVDTARAPPSSPSSPPSSSSSARRPALRRRRLALRLDRHRHPRVRLRLDRLALHALHAAAARRLLALHGGAGAGGRCAASLVRRTDAASSASTSSPSRAPLLSVRPPSSRLSLPCTCWSSELETQRRERTTVNAWSAARTQTVSRPGACAGAC